MILKVNEIQLTCIRPEVRPGAEASSKVLIIRKFSVFLLSKLKKGLRKPCFDFLHKTLSFPNRFI